MKESENEPEKGAPGKVDVTRLMADIRARVKADLASGGRSEPPFKPTAGNAQSAGTRSAGELVHSEDLRFLNTNYAFSARVSAAEVRSHRPGIIGKIIVKAKQKLLRIIWDSLLKDYLQAERDFNAHVVRFLNDVSKYVDARDAGNFWELIRKIDVDITRALNRIERIADEQSGTLRSTETRILDELYRSLREMTERVTALQAASQSQGSALLQLDSVARGLEGIVAKLGRTEPSPSAQPKSTDYSYVLLENRFRGSEDAIAARLGIYLPVFAGAKLPVLEIGAGRGELQLAFAKQGTPSYGIDFDEGMVSIAKERGAKVDYGDGIAHLRGLPDRSLGGLIAIQVVEHLTQVQQSELYLLAAKKVVPGGRIVFETINPQSVTALSSNYFRDPTHVFPLHPDTLAFALTLAGLDVKEVRKLSPIPEEAQLKYVPTAEFMTPQWRDLVQLFNHNLKQLNDLLYGYQDFCVIAEARA